MAGDTTISVSPSRTAVEIGSTTTLDVVVDSASDAVGGFDLSLSLSDERVADVTGTSVATDSTGQPADASSVSVSSDKNAVDAAAAYLGDDVASGSPTVVSVTVEGVAPGSTDLVVDSATVADGTGTEYTVTGTSAATVSTTWSVNTGGRAQYASPAADMNSGRVFVGGLDSTLHALDAGSGGVAWTKERSGSLSDSSPVLANGRVYVGSGGGTVYAMDATASSATEAWTHSTDSAVVSTPAVSGSDVYVGTNDGRVLALDDGNGGAKLWQTDVGAPVYSTVAVDATSGQVFVTTDDGRLLALDSASGQQQWSKTVGSDLGHSSPVVEGGTVYVAGDAVYAFGTGGTKQWEQSYGGTAGSTPTVDGGTLYVGDATGTVRSMDTANPSSGWTYDTGSTVGSSPAVADGRVAVGADDGNVYLLDAGNGSELRVLGVGGRVRSSPVLSGTVLYVGTDGGQVAMRSGLP